MVKYIIESFRDNEWEEEGKSFEENSYACACLWAKEISNETGMDTRVIKIERTSRVMKTFMPDTYE